MKILIGAATSALLISLLAMYQRTPTALITAGIALTTIVLLVEVYFMFWAKPFE